MMQRILRLILNLGETPERLNRPWEAGTLQAAATVADNYVKHAPLD